MILKKLNEKLVTNRFTKLPYEQVKRIIYKYSSLLSPNYPYNLEPIQLATLVMEIERLHGIEGSILEIGVSRGMTTRFIAQHIHVNNYDEHFYAIDTFSSFLKEDLDYEINKFEKKESELTGFYCADYQKLVTDLKRFDFIKVIQSDCSAVDYKLLSPIKLVLLDVDLYITIKKTLPLIYDQLIDGGVILIDDVLKGTIYDGAERAYKEFCLENNIEPKIIGNKCGIIRKIDKCSVN